MPIVAAHAHASSVRGPGFIEPLLCFCLAAPTSHRCYLYLRLRHLDLEQRPVLLAAEDVPVARASARPKAIDRELDRIAYVEGDEVRYPGVRDAEELRNAVLRDHA